MLYFYYILLYHLYHLASSKKHQKTIFEREANSDTDLAFEHNLAQQKPDWNFHQLLEEIVQLQITLNPQIHDIRKLLETLSAYIHHVVGNREIHTSHVRGFTREQ